MKRLLDSATVARGLDRMAAQIAEKGADFAFVGVRRGGEPLAEALARRVTAETGHEPALGSVDITLYRDDAATALPSPRIGPSHVPFPVDGRRIVLVDDVMFTGRTIRAALDAVLDYGRPRRIELCVVFDRGGRELPIQPDYCIDRHDVAPDGHVEVVALPDGGFEVVELTRAEHAARRTAQPEGESP
ncbi:MAG: bifunctional pyr operon transcriptional regulator/uracil phosphoribosyltransferase PyrR [Myxococcales bacterium]|nr:bifunctional pyr operon transcriptional regulator/uracil phosphoribosyltransferase PyrR [Myxococcales bacterium]